MNDHAKNVRNAYSRAMGALRRNHPEEFHALLEVEYASAGLEVKKRLTGDRKRKAEIERARALLAEAGEVVISD